MRNEYSASSKKQSSNILIIKRKQVEFTKYELELWSTSKQLALSGISGPPRFHCLDENQWFLLEGSITSQNLQIDTLKKHLMSVVLQKQEFEQRDKSILKVFLEILDRQEFNRGVELIVFLTFYFYSKCKNLFWNTCGRN